MISLPTCNQSHLKDDLWIGFKLQSDKEIPKIPSFLVQILHIHMQINWFESIQMGSDRVRITRRWFYSILFHSTYQSRSHLFQTWVKALRWTGLNYSTFPLCTHWHTGPHQRTHLREFGVTCTSTCGQQEPGDSNHLHHSCPKTHPYKSKQAQPATPYGTHMKHHTHCKLS